MAKRGSPGRGVRREPWEVDAASLAKAVQRDRLKRKLTWPAYAKVLDVPLSTLYKIATGRTANPHTLTISQIQERIGMKPPAENPETEGADREVVPSGRGHTE